MEQVNAILLSLLRFSYMKITVSEQFSGVIFSFINYSVTVNYPDKCRHIHGIQQLKIDAWYQFEMF